MIYTIKIISGLICFTLSIVLGFIGFCLAYLGSSFQELGSMCCGVDLETHDDDDFDEDE